MARVEQSPVSPPSSDRHVLSRRNFLKAGLLGAGYVGGYAAARVIDSLGISAKAAELLYEHEINDWEVFPKVPISLGHYGSIHKIPIIEQSFWVPIQRSYDFMAFRHKDIDNIARKIHNMGIVSDMGMIPGFSWSALDPDGRPFTFRDWAHYNRVHKSYVQLVAEGIRNLNVPVEISLYEPNKDGHKPEDFADMYRWVVQTFRDEGVNNVIWGMYVSGQYPLSIGDVKNYYPGRQWIHKFGVSLYNLNLADPTSFTFYLPGNRSALQTAWPWFKELLETTQREVPVVLYECGSGHEDPEVNAAWMMDLMELAYRVGISEVNLFDVNFGGKYSGNIPTVIYDAIKNREVDLDGIEFYERNWEVVNGRLAAFSDVFHEHHSMFDQSRTFEDRVREQGKIAGVDFLADPAVQARVSEVDLKLAEAIIAQEN